ncbi:hypothetical protein QVD17_14883 [Tagetes erecta]|uniref:Uncharacterized protein n=1 Tax=Tagetes erecta TaxID=13708 RepID=A0AAD8NZ53_TARER|nr:hypothetical protein QVD17_14883 [Tagetes erecta]
MSPPESLSQSKWMYCFSRVVGNRRIRFLLGVLDAYFGLYGFDFMLVLVRIPNKVAAQANDRSSSYKITRNLKMEFNLNLLISKKKGTKLEQLVLIRSYQVFRLMLYLGELREAKANIVWDMSMNPLYPPTLLVTTC